MKKFILLLAFLGILFTSCTKTENTYVAPTPTGTANVYVSNYYIDPYNAYQLDVVCTNSGNATAYNVNVRIYTWSGAYYNWYNLSTSSIAPGQSVAGSINCIGYYPYTFAYTIYTPTWN